MGEHDYPMTITCRLVVPKLDNSGDRIDPALLERYVRRAARKYGGVTVIPTVLGCSMEQGKLVCEENFTMEVTITEPTPSKRQADEQWLRNLAHTMGKDLGQRAVFEVEERDIAGREVKGTVARKLPRHKLAPGVLHRYLYQ